MGISRTHSLSGGLGRVGSSNVTGAAQTGITTITDITGLSTTFVAQAGRRYRATITAPFRNTSADQQNIVYIADGADTNLALVAHYNNVANQTETMTGVFELREGTDITAGTITLKGRALTSGGAMSVMHSTGNGTTLIVEDIGPV